MTEEKKKTIAVQETLTVDKAKDLLRKEQENKKDMAIEEINKILVKYGFELRVEHSVNVVPRRK